MLYYTVTIRYDYFTDNREEIEQWHADNMMLYLWYAKGRTNIGDFYLYFDKPEDAMACRLRFECV